MNGLMKTVKGIGDKHGSLLCVIGALLGLGVTVYETYITRPKIDKIMDEHKKAVEVIKADNNKTEEEKRKAINGERVETAKKVGITAIPIAVPVVTTGGFTVAGGVINMHKLTEAAATIAVGDAAYQKLACKVEEVVGKDKADEIKEDIKRDSAKEAIDNLREVQEGKSDLSIIEQGKGGNVLYYDAIFGKLFRSDDATIMKVCASLSNKRFSKAFEPYIGYDEFFDAMELDVPRGAGYARFENGLEPCLNNTMKYGDVAVIILDWYVDPTWSKK